MIEIKRYSEADKPRWNEFLEKSKNGTFMLSRNFMDYHKDQFEDFSLMIYDNDKLAGLFPANKKNNEIYSHSGLTYGGLLVGRAESSKNIICFVGELLKYCQSEQIDKITIKQSPSFYSTISQDEIDYAFFIANAKLSRVDIAYAVAQQVEKIPYQQRRLRAIRKATNHGIIVKETNDFSDFWNVILIPNLLNRFGVKPVHSLNEISKLAIDNQGHIRQFEAWKDDTILAGCTIFETPTTAHAQYISASDEGRSTGAIDLLFHQLISEIYKNKNFFDLGIVNENNGSKINVGLLDWKEGFGARAYAHRFYEIDPSQHIYITQALTQ